MPKVFYVEAKPLPVSPLAVDVQIDEKKKHVRWYNMERWHDVDFVKKVQVDDTTFQIVTDSKIFTFKDLDLKLYDEKLKGKIHRNFNSDTEVQDFFISQLNKPQY